MLDHFSSRVPARVGLLGNPSDGYGGKAIALAITNFEAEVSIAPSPVVRFIPNPEEDPQQFDSLEAFGSQVQSHGFYGGVRLLKAAAYSFWAYCNAAGLVLPARCFALSYRTTIPRQRGLSGSSAIVVGALNCLIRFYGLEGHVPPSDRPGLALRAEEQLGIAAGWQDRVIQVHGGLLYMDFDPGIMQSRGRGAYVALDSGLLPPLYLVYSAGDAPGKDSGAVHSGVRSRWLAGDADARRTMSEIAGLVEQGRDALLRRQHGRLADLMAQNFALRRRLFGDAALGEASLRLVQVAAGTGAAAKFPGSGGAALACCPHGPDQVHRLELACSQAGLQCVLLQPAPALLPVD